MCAEGGRFTWCPAHHFGNVTGLLTELAADGFERLAEAMNPTRVKNADDDLEASGLGYIQFAMKWPEHFRVMYHSELLDQQSPRLRLARERGERIVRDALIHANENRTRYAVFRAGIDPHGAW